MSTLYMRSLVVGLGLTSLCASAADVIGAAGTVLLAVGGATVNRSAGETTTLGRGAVLAVGDRIVTRDGAHVHIRLRDGGLVAVRPNSIFEITQFEYDPDQPQTGKVRYLLSHGVVRSVTGKVGEANKDAFRLNTPVAAIGVRGTDFVTASDDVATRVAVRSGAVIVASFGGSCSASGLGACVETGVLMRAGGDARLVEVDASERIPRLRKERTDDLQPDRRNPGLSSEPLAGAGPEKREEGRNAGVIAAVSEAIARDEVRNAVPTPMPAPVASPVLAPIEPTAVRWGRWGGNTLPADMPSASVMQQLGVPIQIATSRFALGVDGVGDAFAQRGSANFGIHTADAYVFSGGGTSRAAVENGQLAIQFDSRRFDTSFTVVEQSGTRNDLAATGTVVRGGYLVSDPYQSNAKFYGVLASDLNQVGTLFETLPKGGKELSGAIHWRR